MTAATVERMRGSAPRVAALTTRDYVVLQYVLEGYQETQPNVDVAIFGGSSKTPVSRSVARLAAAGYLLVERWNGIGVNFLRGTSRGRAALIARGVDASALFIPERSVAAKDLAHHMWINDLRLILRQSGVVDPAPCWALRRKLAELRVPAIPDLLAFPTTTDGTSLGVLAIEVDLGTEPLKVFLPKLQLLRDMLATWANGEPAVVLVFTVGPRRILAMRHRVAEQRHPTGVLILPLPKTTGGPAVRDLRALLNAALHTPLITDPTPNLQRT